MSAIHSHPHRRAPALSRLWDFNRLFSNDKFQAWVSNIPVLRRIARTEGEDIFDLIMGFVNAQVLWALVELRILNSLLDGPKQIAEISAAAALSPERAEILMNGATALGLTKRRANGVYALRRKGASLLGVPGLTDMVRHHAHFYRDMANPVALLRDEVDTELSHFWPYVFGASDSAPMQVTENYSNLMAASQKLVAHDTLKMVTFRSGNAILDVGGGTGNFAIELARKFTDVRVSVFDLPQVKPAADAHLLAKGFSDRITFQPGSFRDEPLPLGYDAITLIRVLYDHSDSTVMDLLKRAYDALSEGGRLIVSEPMSGGDKPHRAGDVYFAFYTMAMRTGKARSANQIAQMCQKIGFRSILIPKAPRKFITSAVICVK